MAVMPTADLWHPGAMVRAWNDIDWDRPRPSLEELIESWASIRWEAHELSEPAVDQFLAAVASTHVNGGWLIGRFKALAFSDDTQWDASTGRSSHRGAEQPSTLNRNSTRSPSGFIAVTA